MSLSGLPADTKDKNYAPLILSLVEKGEHDAPVWLPVTSTIKDHTAVFYVMSDALSIEGVRVSVSATLEQQIADTLGASLLTPKLADLAFMQRGACKLLPTPRVISSKTADMITNSEAIDTQLAAQGNPTGIKQTVGKHWTICNALALHPNKAVNYGWHFVKSFGGQRWAPCVSAPNTDCRVIQDPGWFHDRTHIDYCLDPSTRVLTADLRWIPIGNIQPGEELVGFDEELRGTHLRRAVVEATSQLTQECFEIVTSKTTIIASGLHRWPVRGAAFYPRERGVKNWKPQRIPTLGWRATKDLKVGDLIPHFCDPWEQDTSWDGAWMAGFLDGEGWLSGSTFGAGQNPGMFRPLRLMAKSAGAWEGRRACGGKRSIYDASAEVLEIRPVGRRRVVGLQTSTNTFIAEGLLSHNSQTCVLVARLCSVDGVDRDLHDILKDPALASLASHEGVVRVLRQPGVPEPPALYVAAKAAARILSGK
jgi:hypothetical protein